MGCRSWSFLKFCANGWGFEHNLRWEEALVLQLYIHIHMNWNSYIGPSVNAAFWSLRNTLKNMLPFTILQTAGLSHVHEMFGVPFRPNDIVIYNPILAWSSARSVLFIDWKHSISWLEFGLAMWSWMSSGIVAVGFVNTLSQHVFSSVHECGMVGPWQNHELLGCSFQHIWSSKYIVFIKIGFWVCKESERVEHWNNIL